MGICVSTASAETHEVDGGNENLVRIQDALQNNRILRLDSLHSQQGNKGPNQDAAILYQGYGTEDGTFCGVFDGHGKNGHVISKLVRNRLPSLVLDRKNALSALNATVNQDYGDQEDELSDDLVPNKTFREWKEACLSVFKVIDKELKLHENLDCSCSGTTAVVIIKQAEDLVIANLGDSRAILGTMTEDGLVAVQLTTDLKPSLPKEAERIKKNSGRIFSLKNEPHIQRVWLPNDNFPGLAMTRAFGDFKLKNHGIIAIPEITHHRLSVNDQFLVLATDGVWDVLSIKEVTSIVWLAKSEKEAARAVVDAAVTAWRSKFPTSKMDDCTVLCLFTGEKSENAIPTNLI
ncbi:PREDICTED: probable protein phosphatase 2C 72 [Nelumbo nucifera]|uniref:PPM-type phosphatase domain-containing protein n=2 Tax=Nelumbo nucifera TaxID=4432 RepID=A0A822ZLY7_NELNU|nr:PREDICTED: probable protein phosphatase 2C 72 [Nelumbo nucifera]DAD44495.1 TPA_asm: hypothetical protein HUJ06_002725 [Nelumbo nucifera]